MDSIMEKESKTFKEKMLDYMRATTSVKDLKEILDDLVENGFGDARVAYRIGHTNDAIPKAVNFPLADIRIADDKSMVLFTPAARVKDFKDRKIPEFDIVASFDEKSMKLSFEKILFA